MATVDVAPLVTPAYTASLLVPTDGSTFTQALLTNLIVALGNRIEFLRDLTPEATDTPEAYFTLREDFAGAIFDDSQSRLDASFPWRTNQTGLVSINHSAGSFKNPGVLQCAIPGDGVGDQIFEFHLGLDTGTPGSYSTFRQMVVTVKIEEDVANLNEQIRFGLVDDAGASNGGSDCICLFRSKAISATKWLLLVRVAGVQTLTTLTASSFTNGVFTTWRIFRNSATGSYEFYQDGALVYTLAIGDQPSGACNYSFRAGTSSADTEVLGVFWDLIHIRTFPGDRISS